MEQRIAILDENRTVKGVFNTSKEAAQAAGVSRCSVSRLIEKRTINGVLFIYYNNIGTFLGMTEEEYSTLFNSCYRVIMYDSKGNLCHRFTSVKDCASFLGVSTGLVDYRIRRGLKIGQYIPTYNNDEPPRVKVREKSTYSYKKKDTDTFVHYEKQRNVFLITPCPYRDWDEGKRPFVGSARCASCSSFRGNDKQNQTVRCAAHHGYNKNKKS